MSAKLPAIPSIPGNLDPALYKILSPIKQALESGAFNKAISNADKPPLVQDHGGPVTPDDLVNAGVPAGWLSDVPPPAPTDVSPIGAIGYNLVRWQWPTYGNHAHTEIWRAESDDFSSAKLVGMSPSSTFMDPFDTPTQAYYWVRFVSTASIKGPYNSLTGSPATSRPLVNGIRPGDITQELMAAKSVRALQVDTLDLVTNTAITGELVANSGFVNKLTSSTAFVDGLTANTAYINALTAKAAFISSVQANVLTANSIKASMIDGRGLTIRDNAGNVILGVGSPLPVAYADPGLRNDRQEWSQVNNRPNDDAIRNNMIDVSWWRRDAPIPWTSNGEYNRIIYTSATGGDTWIPGPKGGGDFVWYCQETTGNGEQGGGWSHIPLVLDHTKTYRFVLPVYRVRGNGQAYWGTDNVCKLNTTEGQPNPYFASSASLLLGRWYLMVGYIFPAGAIGNNSDSAGIWDCTTGEKVADGSNWNFIAGVNSVYHRAYQYYAEKDASQLFGRPMVNLVDGTEPSLREYFASSAILNEKKPTDSGNLLYNSEYRSAGLRGARIRWNQNNTPIQRLDLADRIWPPGDWMPPGVRGWAINTGAPNGGGVIDIGLSDDYFNVVPVTPGERYEFSASLATHRCGAGIFILFVGRDNHARGSETIKSFEGQMAQSQYPRLDEFQRLTVFAVAPPEAASVLAVVRKYDTLPGHGDSWLWCLQPYFGKASLLQDKPSAYVGTDGATYGATLGTNVSGQITDANRTTLIADNAFTPVGMTMDPNLGLVIHKRGDPNKRFFVANSNSAPWIQNIISSAPANGALLVGEYDEANNRQFIRALSANGSVDLSTSSNGMAVEVNGLGAEIDHVALHADLAMTTHVTAASGFNFMLEPYSIYRITGSLWVHSPTNSGVTIMAKAPGDSALRTVVHTVNTASTYTQIPNSWQSVIDGRFYTIWQYGTIASPSLDCPHVFDITVVTQARGGMFQILQGMTVGTGILRSGSFMKLAKLRKTQALPPSIAQPPWGMPTYQSDQHFVRVGGVTGVVGIYINSDGTWRLSGTQPRSGNWNNVTSASVGAGCEVQFVASITGKASNTSANLINDASNWMSLGASRSCVLQASTSSPGRIEANGSARATVTINLRLAGGPASSHTITLDVDNTVNVDDH
ncbi:hypothetical protein ACUHMQ_06610 [Chitinimonas sp. PSY-7]|uniref:hypothetical protein n=1 Tax=Chitinimonas sp. PSY-7 TaxID=3459088 RepID=UPI004040088C